MSIKPMIFLIFFAIFPAFSFASGDELLRQCKLALTEPSKIDGNPILSAIDIGYCFGYVRGVSDYATGTAPMTPEQLATFKSCRPESVNNKQIAAIVVKFIEDNPAIRHFDQTTLVALALNNAFPCAK